MATLSGGSISDLSVRVPAGGNGLDLEDGAVGRDVAVTGGSDDSIGVLLDQSSLVSSTVTMASRSGTVAAQSNNNPTASESLIIDSTLSAFRAAAVTGAIEVLRTTLIGAAGFRYTAGPGGAVLLDDVIRIDTAGGNGISLGDSSDNNSAQIVVEGVTIDGAGAAGTTTGIAENASGAATNVNVLADDAVIWDVTRAWRRTMSGGANSVSVSLNHADVVATDPDGCSCGPGLESLNSVVNTDPLLVNAAAGDLHLRFGSPAIDVGLGIQGSFDRDSLPRKVNATATANAHTDEGAYEYQHRAPVPAVAPPTAVGLGAATTFDGSGSSDPDDGDTLTYAWAFDDGATATGPVAVHTFSTPGAHRATLSVTDSSGLAASVVAVATVVAPVTAAPPPPPPPTAKADRTAPKLSGLKVRAGKVTLTLSEAATVTVAEEHLLTHGRRHTVRTLRHKLTKGKHRFSVGSLSAGRYHLVVRATDAAGNRSSSHTLSLTQKSKPKAKKPKH